MLCSTILAVKRATCLLALAAFHLWLGLFVSLKFRKADNLILWCGPCAFLSGSCLLYGYNPLVLKRVMPDLFYSYSIWHKIQGGFSFRVSLVPILAWGIFVTSNFCCQEFFFDDQILLLLPSMALAGFVHYGLWTDLNMWYGSNFCHCIARSLAVQKMLGETADDCSQSSSIVKPQTYELHRTGCVSNIFRFYLNWWGSVYVCEPYIHIIKELISSWHMRLTLL